MSLDLSQRERIALEWSAGVWIGAVRRAFGPVAELVAGHDGVLVENHPPHSLLVLWKPPKSAVQAPFLRRFPWMVSISAVAERDAALSELLLHLPPDARLYIARHEIDWALMAEIVMLSEKDLAPYHYRELQAFAQAEREATLAAISAGYTRDAGSFRHFVKTVRDELS